MQGGGFTITNLGGIGGTSFTPIVNWPEVAILGMSRGVAGAGLATCSVETRAFEPRLMLPLSLSYDHRVIDGADAARFLRWVCEALEQPFVLRCDTCYVHVLVQRAQTCYVPCSCHVLCRGLRTADCGLRTAD